MFFLTEGLIQIIKSRCKKSELKSDFIKRSTIYLENKLNLRETKSSNLIKTLSFTNSKNICLLKVTQLQHLHDEFSIIHLYDGKESMQCILDIDKAEKYCSTIDNREKIQISINSILVVHEFCIMKLSKNKLIPQLMKFTIIGLDSNINSNQELTKSFKTAIIKEKDSYNKPFSSRQLKNRELDNQLLESGEVKPPVFYKLDYIVTLSTNSIVNVYAYIEDIEEIRVTQIAYKNLIKSRKIFINDSTNIQLKLILINDYAIHFKYKKRDILMFLNLELVCNESDETVYLQTTNNTLFLEMEENFHFDDIELIRNVCNKNNCI